MRGDRFSRALRAVSGFFTFFLLIGFVTSCCITVFLDAMAEDMQIEYTAENIGTAAKATMALVIFLTVIFYSIDLFRRKLSVERPAKRIIEASERIMRGDFSYRIEIGKPSELYNEFDEIALCINNMARELSSIETLRSDFVANVSHEIKTPLAVMSNYAALLCEEGLEEDKRREYVAAISSGAARLSSLVTNILRLNKLENQQIAPVFERYNLSEQLCECLLAFENVWESRGIEIETDIREDVFVRSDSEMMSLVWNNLISNAMKFTDRGGVVAVSLTLEDGEAVVSVRDTGCGISAEVGEHIFEKFYQGDASRSQGGNGLGLALVKRIIDITRSSVSVRSEQGHGSEFTVRMRADV